MRNVHYRVSLNHPTGPDINNHGIQTIVTAEDLLRTIRILHRDAYGEGLFNHEAPPFPLQEWEPIAPGNGDSDSDDENDSGPENDDDDDDNDDDDDDDGRWKGRRKGHEKKYEKRRRGPVRIYTYSSDKKRGAGGEPVNFPELLDTWSICPGEIFSDEQDDEFSDKENESPASLAAADQTVRNVNQLRAVSSSGSRFYQGECTSISSSVRGECSSRNSSYSAQKLDCLGEERTRLLFPDLNSLLDDESRNSIILMKGKAGTKLIVPKIVVQQLDCLKQQEGLREEASKALFVLKWLQECIEDASWWIRIQSLSEVPVEEGQAESAGCLLNLATLSSSSSTSGSAAVSPTIEDYIVQSAHLFKKAERDAKVVILTDSDTLTVKAKGEGLFCQRAKELCDTLLDPSTLGEAYTPRSHRRS